MDTDSRPTSGYISRGCGHVYISSKEARQVQCRLYIAFILTGSQKEPPYSETCPKQAPEGKAKSVCVRQELARDGSVINEMLFG